MRKFQRFTALTLLAAFLGMTALGTVHHHADFQPDSHCTVCKVVQQTPMLSAPASLDHSDVLISQTPISAVPHPYLQFVFSSHGRSPPTL
jgi:hypothetical protein